MSVTPVSAELRRLVIQRARHLCEYCLILDDDVVWTGQMDHIISEKHGGSTDATNLAYACADCNRAKGSDIATLAPDSRSLVPLFNPRLDKWSEHFVLDGSRIEGRTPIGRATSTILGFNDYERVKERGILIELGRYPSPAALVFM